MITAERLHELLTTLDDISDVQTFQVMLHLREINAAALDPVRETMASFNACTEEQALEVIKQIKTQFKDDWDNILELIGKHNGGYSKIEQSS